MYICPSLQQRPVILVPRGVGIRTRPSRPLSCVSSCVSILCTLLGPLILPLSARPRPAGLLGSLGSRPSALLCYATLSRSVLYAYYSTFSPRCTCLWYPPAVIMSILSTLYSTVLYIYPLIGIEFTCFLSQPILTLSKPGQFVSPLEEPLPIPNKHALVFYTRGEFFPP